MNLSHMLILVSDSRHVFRSGGIALVHDLLFDLDVWYEQVQGNHVVVRTILKI
jgi:hypothetical protein